MKTVFRKNWQELVKPTKPDLRSEQNITTLVLEPLERGFGYTLGHSLRRVLLSSLPGAAVTSVRIAGSPKVFASDEERLDAITELILNIKEIALRMDAESAPGQLIIQQRGPGAVLAGNARASGGIEILNPDHPICVVEPGCEMTLEMMVGYGRGYQPAEPLALEQNDGPIFIPVNALYSPVRRVNVVVENTRHGQVLDYDRLILTVVTNGVLSGDDALSHAAQILRDQFSVFINFEEAQLEQPEPPQNELPFNPVLLKRMDEFELSVRSSNCMKNDNIVYLGDLVSMTEAQLLRVPNFGRKSLNEIKALLAELGLRLGMEIPEWPPVDLGEMAARYSKEWS